MTEYMEQETFPRSGGLEVFAMKKGLTELDLSWTAAVPWADWRGISSATSTL